MQPQWKYNLFQNYPNQFKDGFIQEIESSNYTRGKIVAIVLVIISIAMYLVAVLIGDIAFIKRVNLLLVLLSVINMVLFSIHSPKKNILTTYHRVIIYYEILIVIAWGSVLMAFVPNRYELFGTYSIVILTISSLFFLRWQINLMFLSLSILCIIPISFNYLLDPILPKLIIMISSVIASWIISRLLYIKEMQNFVVEKLLEQQRNNFKQEVIEQTKQFARYEERNIKEIITAFIKLLDIHEPCTNGHSLKVASFAEKIAFELSLSLEEIQEAYWSGMVHDIGKLLIPTEILNKEGTLEDDEYNLIKQHPIWGFKALSSVQPLNKIAVNILHHHERWDGKGYPHGLKNDEIPYISQILTVADAWDAMTSDRSYRTALSKEDALEELEGCKDTYFSPVVTDVFINMIKRNLL